MSEIKKLKGGTYFVAFGAPKVDGSCRGSGLQSPARKVNKVVKAVNEKRALISQVKDQALENYNDETAAMWHGFPAEFLAIYMRKCETETLAAVQQRLSNLKNKDFLPDDSFRTQHGMVLSVQRGSYKPLSDRVKAPPSLHRTKKRKRSDENTPSSKSPSLKDLLKLMIEGKTQTGGPIVNPKPNMVRVSEDPTSGLVPAASSGGGANQQCGLEEFLENREYGDYIDCVKQSGIRNLHELKYANDEDLRGMGIANKFHRRRIIGDLTNLFSP